MTNPFQIKWDIIPTVSGWVVNIEKGFLMRVELVHNNIAVIDFIIQSRVKKFII